ncbi:MAG: M23 family metallopeptidase [Sphingomonadales bacterium]|nr:M23 family metallopeptidase [Sphingomonadales bacterium]
MAAIQDGAWPQMIACARLPSAPNARVSNLPPRWAEATALPACCNAPGSAAAISTACWAWSAVLPGWPISSPAHRSRSYSDGAPRKTAQGRSKSSISVPVSTCASPSTAQKAARFRSIASRSWWIPRRCAFAALWGKACIARPVRQALRQNRCRISLKIIAGHASLSSIAADDEFDLIVDYKRAATGEVLVGDLLYAGIDRGGKPRIQMLKWANGDSSQWFEASGVGESRGQLSRPVNGGVSSGFGMRRHPILGYKRMHSGLDFKAGYSAPIFAATNGVVAYAGRKGGYGNFVQLNHGGGIATGYAHMSRIAASPGQRVRQGQIIGYVGSTGLSTGPHLHYELYRDGRPVNPLSITFTQRAQLSGGDLSRFKGELARLKAVKPGAALAPTPAASRRNETPEREIDRISAAKVGPGGSAL